MSALTFQTKENVIVKFPSLVEGKTLRFSFPKFPKGIMKITKKIYKNTFIYHFLRVLKAPVE